MVRKVRPFHLGTGVGEQCFGIPTVAAHEHLAGNAGGLGLPGDGHHGRVVDGGVDEVGLRVAELRDVSGEVGFCLEKALLDDDLAPEALHLGFELGRETRRVKII